MGRNAIETILGALVLLVACLFLVFAYKSADLHKVEGYVVSANFPMVDGLKDGTDVKVNGVKVGSIASMDLITAPGPTQYMVDVRMTILPNVLLPTDTVAIAASESLLGGKYVSLEVGVDDEMIKTDGTGKIARTQAPMRLDDLIGQLIYSNKKGDNAAPAAAAPAAPAASAPTSSAPVAAAPTPAAPAAHPAATPNAAPRAATTPSAPATMDTAPEPEHP